MALKNKQNRTIVLSISEQLYTSFLEDQQTAHEIIQMTYAEHPELFPLAMSQGYMLNGFTRESKKMNIQLRKIKVGGVSYRIRPAFVLPYMRAKTQDVSKPLFLLRFGVPFWALAFVFGHNAMWWYRLYLCLSQFNLVGTTAYDLDKMPTDLLADEHHIRIKGHKAYVATTIGGGCFLGMETCKHASEENLIKGYGVFEREIHRIQPDYQPHTVNTDGWSATQGAWKQLFPSVAIIECFLHAFLKIRERATKKLKAFFDTAADKVWNCYRAESKRQLAQQIRRLTEWAQAKLPYCPMKENILRLCKKKKRWIKHLDFPLAHRTSNMLDRLMRSMKRHALNSQMFHATLTSTSKNFRAFALLVNFSPSSPAVLKKNQELDSPAARLNGFVYHRDWLQNLFIAASLGGDKIHRNPL